jgi:hypothetical protein
VETFVVRIWTPAQELAAEMPAGELHGVVERVGADYRAPFRNAQELLEILRSAAQPPSALPPAGFKGT